MRFLLLIAALIGLLASPVAAEARSGCGDAPGMGVMQGHGAPMTMTAASMDHSNCDKSRHHKDGSSGCGLACLAMCGALAALPVQAAVPTRSAVVVAVLSIPAMTSPRSYPSQRLERPPRKTV